MVAGLYLVTQMDTECAKQLSIALLVFPMSFSAFSNVSKNFSQWQGSCLALTGQQLTLVFFKNDSIVCGICYFWVSFSRPRQNSSSFQPIRLQTGPAASHTPRQHGNHGFEKRAKNHQLTGKGVATVIIAEDHNGASSICCFSLFRAIYLRHSLLAKLVFYFILLVVWHGWLVTKVWA